MDDESNELGDDSIGNRSPNNNENRILSINNRIEGISRELILDTFQNLMLDCKSLSNTSSNKYLVNFYNQHENVYGMLSNTRMKYSDFNILKTIGQGAFGQVQLVRHKPTGELFALKILNKAQVVTCEGTIFWREERDIMVEIDSIWIVKMHYSFQDSKRLYMVMDYLPGGNLVTWMSKLDILSEKDVCFYAAEIVLAIHDLHKYGFVHRDIKPDNILFTERGHIKLADFGSCVKLDPKTKYVNCNRAIGTPDYISPEVLLSQSNNTKYGKEVDWWALGVMLYEIFYGEPPFYSDNLVNTYSKIMTHEQSLSFPPDEEVSEMAVDFMKNLICDRSMRLGQTDDLSDIKLHRFFSSTNTKWKWDNIQNFTPPFIPELENDLDTTYFDFEDEDVDRNFLTLNSQELKPTIFNGENLQFSGFSYTKYENTVNNCQKENNKSNILIGKDRSESKINNQIETNKDALDKLLIEKKDLENQLHTANSNLKSEVLISKKLQIDYSELLKNHANCEKKIENLEETTHKLSAELVKHQNSSVQEKENLVSEIKKMEAYNKSSSMKLMEMQAEYHQSKLRCIKLENDLSRLKNDGSLQEKSTNVKNDSDHLRSDLEKALTENNSLSRTLENLQIDKEQLKSSLSDLQSEIQRQTKDHEEKDKQIKDMKMEIEKYKKSLEDKDKKEQASNYKMSLIIKSKSADKNKYEQELEDQRNKLSKIIQTKTYEIQQMKANIESLTESNSKLSELVELDKVKQNSLIEKINEIILGQSSTAKEMMIAEDLKSGVLNKRTGRQYIQLSKEGKKKEYMYEELQKRFNSKSAELMKQIDVLNKEKEQIEHENSNLKEQINRLMNDQLNFSESPNRGSVSTIASSHSSFDSGFPLDSSHVSSTPRRTIKQFGRPPLNHLHSLKILNHNSKHDTSDVFHDVGEEFSDLKIRSKKPTAIDYRQSRSANATLERPRLDQQLEVNVKLKGKKMAWEKRFVQCDDQYIYFYYQDMNKYHFRILISSLDFVRSVTTADVIHAKKSEIPRIFQICYDKNAIFYQKTLLTKSMSRSSNSLNSGDSGKSANSVEEHDSTIQHDIVDKKDNRKSSLSRFIPIIGLRNRKTFKGSLETIIDPLESPIFLRGHFFHMVNIDKISTCHICNQPFESSSISNETKTLANSDSKIVSSPESSGLLSSLVYLHKVYQCYHCSITVHGNDLNSKIFFCKESSAIQLCRASSEVEQANWIKYLNQFVKSQVNTSMNSGAATPVMKNHPLVN